MGRPHVPLRRVLLPWVTGATLLVLTAYAVWRVGTSHDDVVERERARLQANVESAVETWEDRLIDQLTGELEDVAALDPDQYAERERTLRRRDLAEAIYVWTAPTNPSTNKPHIVFPVSNGGAVDNRLRASPCLRDNALRSELFPADRAGAMRSLTACRHEEDPNVQLVAASRAALMLHEAGQFGDELATLESVDLALSANERIPGPTGIPLEVAVRRGIDPFRLASIRTQRADLLLRLQRVDEAVALLETLGDQIAKLDAPDYATTKPLFAHVILDELNKHRPGDQTAAVTRKFEAADRRIQAYKEITNRIVPTASAGRLGDAPRFIYDQYSDRPFVLFYGWADHLGIALQLEQPDLLDKLLRQLAQFRDHVEITDASGRHVFGKREPGGDAVVVQFTRTLPHLRVHVHDAALAPFLHDEDPWAGVVLIGVCLVLGLIALGGQVQANRQMAELLDRQRAFTTRVTHELKTPLAGIRVMAENLGTGAFRGEDQRAEMATRILGEVDRLTARVDEVLAVARERTIPSPRPFDPEEVLLTLVEEWGPRFEVEGIDLHADLGTTDPVSGDANALRDAVACLLDNALKYRRADGTVRPQVWLELAQDGRRVIIDVTDNGIGVPRTMRKAIFGRFVRVEGDNRGKAGGHGLGLHQVREIVRAHKGTVACTEGVDGGAKFEIFLPALTNR